MKKEINLANTTFENVTIVISATDENKSLLETVDTLMEICNVCDIGLFLIVIPENADVKCIDAIDALKSKYPGIIKKLVQHNPYIGGAMRDAIEEVESSHIIFTSADIPVNLDVFPVMIEKAKTNPGVIVKISRWLCKGSFEGYGQIRKTVNFLAQKFLRFLFKSELTDMTTPILIAPTEIYKRIIFKEWNFPCLLEAVLVPVKAGYKIEEIPAICSSRKEGRSKNTVLQTALYLRTAIRIRYSQINSIFHTDNSDDEST